MISEAPGFLEPPPLAFAHRGGAAAGDENTAEAFGRAVALGYRFVETDVHSTRDGVPVVLHDATLDRVTGQEGSISTLTWNDIRSFRVAGASVIPRLDEVLATWPDVKFNIDVKSDLAVEPTVAAVEQADATRRVLLASFSDARMRRMRALTDAATSLAQRETIRLWAASRLHLARAKQRAAAPSSGERLAERDVRAALRPPRAPVAAQVPLKAVDRRFLSAAHRAGLQVHVWTIDDPTVMAGLLDLGVDGIMTDRIDVLREVFVHRGLWKE